MRELSGMKDLFGFTPSPGLVSLCERATNVIGKPIGFAHYEEVRKVMRLPGNSPFGTAKIMPGFPIAVVLLSKTLLSGCPPADIEAVAAHEMTHLTLTAKGFWRVSVENSPQYMANAKFSPYVGFSSTLEDSVVNQMIAEEGFDVPSRFRIRLDGFLEMLKQPDYPGEKPWDEDYNMLYSIGTLLQMVSPLDQIRKLVDSRSPQTWRWYASILDHVSGYDLLDHNQHNACLVWLSRQLKGEPKVKFVLEDSFKSVRIPDSVVDEIAKIAPKPKGE